MSKAGTLTLIGVLLMAAAGAGVGTVAGSTGAAGAPVLDGGQGTTTPGAVGPGQTPAVRTAASGRTTTFQAASFLQGTVRTETNEPVANATIRVTGANYSQTFANVTDANGDYTVEVPPSGNGTYTVEVIEPGFRTFSGAVSVAAGETARIDVTLRERQQVAAICVKPATDVAFVGEEVSVTVIALAGTTRDSPRVPGVTLELSTGDPAVRVVGSSVGTTDANGTVEFTITADEPARANLTATIVGRGVSVTNGSIDVRSSTGTLAVSARNASGAPVADADVRVAGPGYDRTFANATNASGAVRIDVPVATDAGYDVTVSEPGSEPATARNVTVGPGEVVDVSARLVANGSRASGAFPAGVPGVGTGTAPVDVDGDGVAEDVDGDGRADFLDVVALLSADWGAINDDVAMRAALDVDGDGRVGFLDVVALLFEV